MKHHSPAARIYSTQHLSHTYNNINNNVLLYYISKSILSKMMITKTPLKHLSSDYVIISINFDEQKIISQLQFTPNGVYFDPLDNRYLDIVTRHKEAEYIMSV